MWKYVCLVLDALAFERLLGPCMDIMKRNEERYKEMLADAFNRKVKYHSKYDLYLQLHWRSIWKVIRGVKVLEKVKNMWWNQT